MTMSDISVIKEALSDLFQEVTGYGNSTSRIYQVAI